MAIDINTIKKDFPILERLVNGKRLVYLDNAATSQKPKSVIESLNNFYFNNNSNIHRGLYTLSEEASNMYDESRKNISNFLGAAREDEIIFTSGTTESTNMIAFGWGEKNLNEGDEIISFLSEHHSNFVPWQQLCRKLKLKFYVQDIKDDFSFDMEEFYSRVNSKTKLIALSHASNVLGNIFDIKTIIHNVKKINPNVRIFVDGAQAAPHLNINLKSLDCDFYVISGHKMLGPTGVGILYIRKEIQNEVNPIKFGGGMIKEVYFDDSTFKNTCEKFEGGTPNIAGVIGMSAAFYYLKNIGMNEVREHELDLLKYFFEKAETYAGIEIYGTKNILERTGLISFNLTGIHPHDVASVLSSEGIAVRSGHHCTMPLHKHLQIPGSVRASFYIYNDKKDIDDLFNGLLKAQKILA